MLKVPHRPCLAVCQISGRARSLQPPTPIQHLTSRPPPPLPPQLRLQNFKSTPAPRTAKEAKRAGPWAVSTTVGKPDGASLTSPPTEIRSCTTPSTTTSPRTRQPAPSALPGPERRKNEGTPCPDGLGADALCARASARSIPQPPPPLGPPLPSHQPKLLRPFDSRRSRSRRRRRRRNGASPMGSRRATHWTRRRGSARTAPRPSAAPYARCALRTSISGPREDGRARQRRLRRAPGVWGIAQTPGTSLMPACSPTSTSDDPVARQMPQVPSRHRILTHIRCLDGGIASDGRLSGLAPSVQVPTHLDPEAPAQRRTVPPAPPATRRQWESRRPHSPLFPAQFVRVLVAILGAISGTWALFCPSAGLYLSKPTLGRRQRTSVIA